VKNATEAPVALGESALMDLQRLAIVVAAVLLAGSLVFAAGRIAADDNMPRPVPTTAPAGEAPVLRLGDGSRSHSTSAPLLPTPTPAATLTPRTRQDSGAQESNPAPLVSSDGDN
jgi:hypothetical protein